MLLQISLNLKEIKENIVSGLKQNLQIEKDKAKNASDMLKKLKNKKLYQF